VTQTGFIHRFIPADNPNEKRTLLLLHGTGGDENDLVPLGQTVLPGAAILSPKGRIDEGGMARFFRRFAEGVFDVPNIIEEADALADFVAGAAQEYGFDRARVVAVGFSNGANMAHSLLMLHPEVVQEAVLIRASVTLPDLALQNLEGKRVFMSNGKSDPLMPIPEVEALAAQLRTAGAEVTQLWLDAGHNLTRSEVDDIRTWLAS
jgi:phospholipase/carboxylesterase